jgi:ribosomal protein S3
MGKKVNPNIYNQTEKLNKQSQYIEKKNLDYSVLLKKDLEIKTFVQKFFKTYQTIINKSKILFLNNFLYVYLPYYQKMNYNFLILDKFYKNKIILNCFNYKKIKSFKNNILKKTIKDNILLIKIVKYMFIKTSKFLELNLILENFCIGLKNFLPDKYYIFIIIERQNKKLVIFQKKKLIIKRKHKFINLRKYKDHKFFKQGISLITACVASKNASKLLAEYIVAQIQKLRHHNFFLRFVKSTLNLLSNKIFYSKIKGIKIQIKGRFNNYSRTKIYKVKILSIPPVLTKNVNINFNQKIAYTQSGCFGIKI